MDHRLFYPLPPRVTSRALLPTQTDRQKQQQQQALPCGTFYFCSIIIIRAKHTALLTELTYSDFIIVIPVNYDSSSNVQFYLAVVLPLGQLWK